MDLSTQWVWVQGHWVLLVVAFVLWAWPVLVRHFAKPIPGSALDKVLTSYEDMMIGSVRRVVTTWGLDKKYPMVGWVLQVLGSVPAIQEEDPAHQGRDEYETERLEKDRPSKEPSFVPVLPTAMLSLGDRPTLNPTGEQDTPVMPHALSTDKRVIEPPLPAPPEPPTSNVSAK
jgi:hypothetical protein